MPLFVAPAEAGVQASARSGAPFLRLDPGLRRDDQVWSRVRLNRPVAPLFVAPAEAGVQAFARLACRAFAWIPAYAGTTRCGVVRD